MFEGEKPPVPTRDQMAYEDVTQLTKLAPHNVMLARLSDIRIPEEMAADFQNSFIPMLLPYANEEMSFTQTAAIIAGAAKAFAGGDDRRMIEMRAIAPKVIDAMIEDHAIAQRAREFYLSSLRG
jgi:hypothetical protein